MLSGCHCPVRGGVCSLVCGIEPPDLSLCCESDLWCQAGGIGAHPLGEKSLSITPLGVFTSGCALVPSLMRSASSHVMRCWHCSGPHQTMGIMAHGPGVSQLLFSQGHHHRFSEVRSWDCIQHGAGPTVVLWGSSGSVLAQPLCVGAHKVYSCQSYTCHE